MFVLIGYMFWVETHYVLSTVPQSVNKKMHSFFACVVTVVLNIVLTKCEDKMF